ncbi:hypothetical protein TSUD_296580 [Trifolium subterraneum]|uniref:Uncharacterized protein n=1 Tax=Trifolium subterraneum TaxID=3900 RepID=A0A2Z6LWH4_TRISU|nr:hypothetical protein TSUD_296580 [Trifolium subterraneum]
MLPSMVKACLLEISYGLELLDVESQGIKGTRLKLGTQDVVDNEPKIKVTASWVKLRKMELEVLVMNNAFPGTENVCSGLYEPVHVMLEPVHNFRYMF